MNRQEEKITLGLAGDVMIGRLVDDYLNDVPPKYIWGNLLPFLQSTDLNLINLETTLTHSVNTIPKTFNFKASPSKVQSLIEGSIHVVNLANNHILDYSGEGLLETLDTLKTAHIQHIGAGKNFSEAAAPVILSRKGIKIGILGCTDNEEEWKATESHPGTFYLEVGDLEAIRNSIIKLRPQVDLLILSIHWGPNMRQRPSAQFRAFAHQLIDTGADLIHGHSAHIFQGVEAYRGKLILYDTGDFIDDYAVDSILRNDRSFFFLVDINKNGIRFLRLIPTLISNFQVNRAQGTEAQEALQLMQNLSQELHTLLQIEQNELVFRF
jgi:poly-gamma-glutamate capsule biosynthesis protein CapA/YwtB (metallophosphatase superfamily)